MAARVWKGVYPHGFWMLPSLSLNKFFNLSTPSMRKVDDGGKKQEEKREEKIISFIVATYVVASQLPK